MAGKVVDQFLVQCNTLLITVVVFLGFKIPVFTIDKIRNFGFFK